MELERRLFPIQFFLKYLTVMNFVNADEIARGLSPFNPEKASIKAGRLMLERIAEL